MRTLFAAFGGRTNSSKALLDLIDCPVADKLYLKNSFKTAPEQLRTKLAPDDYDLVILFGQRKMLRDKSSKASSSAHDQHTRSPKAAPSTLVQHPKSPKTSSTNIVRLETVGRDSRVAYHTEVDFPSLAERLTRCGLDPIISKNAGRYLCNNLYFHALKFVDEQPLKAKVLFIHIPKLRQSPDLTQIAAALTASLDETVLQNPPL